MEFLCPVKNTSDFAVVSVNFTRSPVYTVPEGEDTVSVCISLSSIVPVADGLTVEVEYETRDYTAQGE